MWNRTILICNDCRRLINKINKRNNIASGIVQDARVIITEIIEMIKNTIISIIIEYTKDKPAINETFINNPGSFLVREYDRQLKEIRNNREMNLTDTAVEHKEKYTLMRDRFLCNKALIETVRIINTIKSKEEYAFSKYRDH